MVIDSHASDLSVTYAHVVIRQDTLGIIEVLNDAILGRRRINEMSTVMVRDLCAR